MTRVVLADVAEVNPRAVVKPAGDDPVAFIPMAQLDQVSGVTSMGETRRFSDVSTGYTLFEDGDLLVAKITPCFENNKIGQARLRHAVGAGSTEFHVVRPNRELIDDRYLLHFLRQDHIRIDGERRMTGSGGQRRVPPAFLRELQVPLMPLEEQRRVAAILDQVDALRAKRRQVVTHLEDLTRSIFLDMFGPPGESRWDRVPLGELVSRIDSGTSPNCDSRPAAADEWGVLKLGAVTYGTFRPDENKAYLGAVGSMACNEVRAGDVLMTRKNTRDLVGAVALVNQVRPRLLLPDLVFRLHLDEARLNRRFFHAMMMNPAKRRDVRNLSSGSAASMPNISKARLSGLMLELPPLDLQERFSARIALVEAQRARTRCVEAGEAELFASLQYRAFRATV